MDDRAAKIFDGLRYVAEAKKSFDSTPRWEALPNSRQSSSHQLLVAVRLNGILRGGVQLRLITPAKVWEEDVYGQIEVKLPGSTRWLRLTPVEWRPLHRHDNPSNAPTAHRQVGLFDRWFPFEINAAYGMQAFDQSGPGIAVPLPREPTSFSEYANLCADLWVCADLYELPPPPWARTMV